MKISVTKTTGSTGSNPGKIMSATYRPETAEEKEKVVEIIKSYASQWIGLSRRVQPKQLRLDGCTRMDGSPSESYYDVSPKDAVGNPASFDVVAVSGLNKVSHKLGVPRHAGYSKLYQHLAAIAATHTPAR